MTSHEMQKRIALSTGRAPTRKALYRDAELLAKIPWLESMLETFKQAVPRPTTPVYVPLSNIMQRYFSAALALPDSKIDQRVGIGGARHGSRAGSIARRLRLHEKLAPVSPCCLSSPACSSSLSLRFIRLLNPSA